MFWIWLLNLLIGWLVGWLVDWLIGWLFNWLIHRLIHSFDQPHGQSITFLYTSRLDLLAINSQNVVEKKTLFFSNHRYIYPAYLLPNTTEQMILVMALMSVSRGSSGLPSLSAKRAHRHRASTVTRSSSVALPTPKSFKARIVRRRIFFQSSLQTMPSGTGIQHIKHVEVGFFVAYSII